MTSLLQRVRLLDGTALAAERAFALGTARRRRDPRARGGPRSRRAGWPTSWPSTSAHPSLHPRNDLLKSVVYAMSPQAVTDVWVHGRRVVERGRLTTTSEDDLVARVAALTKGWSV